MLFDVNYEPGGGGWQLAIALQYLKFYLKILYIHKYRISKTFKARDKH